MTPTTQHALIAAHKRTWGIHAQRDPDGTVFLSVVRARGRGADAFPEGPLVELDDRAALDLAEFLHTGAAASTGEARP